MKEETTSKKLPPKLCVGAAGTSSTPIKSSNDEILSNLLRLNNFDSISSIKDESLDIDLSACVTISADASVVMNGNSLSSADFWRVLDESAQNSQLYITNGSDDSQAVSNSSNVDVRRQSVDQPNSFIGNFLRPDPPVFNSGNIFSPLKKNLKIPLSEKLITHKTSPTNFAEKKPRLSAVVKEEPLDQFQNEATENLMTRNHKVVQPAKMPASSDSLNLFKPDALSILSVPGNDFLQRTPEKRQDLPPSSDSEPPAMQTPLSPKLIYKCLDCPDRTLEHNEYLAHDLSSHRISYQCNICGRGFDSEGAVKKHFKVHRRSDPKKDTLKKCPDCGKCLKLGSMWMHRKIHSDNKKYACDICGQKFVQKINLTHHSRVHSIEKPYECPECQKRFQERSHMQRHRKYHAQTRTYRCEKCGKMYKTERCLKVHNLVHLEQRPFACNVCNKSFISNSKLKQHSNIHTGERPFKCNYCPRDFTNFPNWLKHTRRRHKVDHKTGMKLETMPSYCSKKSTKTAVAAIAAVPEKVNDNATTSNAIVNEKKSSEDDLKVLATVPAATKAAPKTQTKRKPKVVPAQTGGAPIFIPNSGESVTQPIFVTTVKATVTTKPKRERKQTAPKQVQKATTSKAGSTIIPSSQLSTLANIKKEVVDVQPTQFNSAIDAKSTSHFGDLHCLSITSAEELIMEQALEMEECGLYKGSNAVSVPASSSIETDNAISSEVAAALRLKIKNEYDVINEDEFFKETKTPQICTSLESSPFSSPASMEFGNTNVNFNNFTGNVNPPIEIPNTPLFYMPAFALNRTNGKTIESNVRDIKTNNGSSTPLNLQQQQQQRILSTQNNIITTTEVQLPTTQALLNHLYFPMAMTMPILVQPNQPLPSVETLFSTQSHLHTKNAMILPTKSVTPVTTTVKTTNSAVQHNLLS